MLLLIAKKYLRWAFKNNVNETANFMKSIKEVLSTNHILSGHDLKEIQLRILFGIKRVLHHIKL